MLPFLIPPPLGQPHSVFGGIIIIIIIIIIMACARSQKQTMKQLKQSSSISSQHSSLQSETYTSQGQLAIKVISSLFVSAVHLRSNDILVTYDKVHFFAFVAVGDKFLLLFSPHGKIVSLSSGETSYNSCVCVCVCVCMFTYIRVYHTCMHTYEYIMCARVCVCANYVDLCFP